MSGHFDSEEDLRINRSNFENSLKQNKLLSHLLESSDQPFGVGYLDGSLGYVNRAFEELTGYTQEELKKLDWLTILTPPEFRAMEQEKLEELQRTGQPVRYEKDYIRKDGTRVPIELLVHLIRNDDGTPQYYYSFITNITERKQAEEVLRDSEKRYLQFFDNPLNGFALCEIITDDKRKPVDFIYLEVNKAFEDFTGLKREEVINKRVKEIFPTEEVEELIKIYGNVALTGESDHFEYPIPSLDKYYDVVAFSPQKMRFIAFFTDITERKLAEDALQRSEERYRTILDNIQDAYIRADNGGNVIMVSPSAARMYGYDSTQEMIGISAISLYENPEDRDSLLEELKKLGKVDDYESKALRKDGTSFYVSLNAQFYQDDQGQIQGTEAFVRDISQRKDIENDLQESQEKFYKAFHYNPAAMTLFDKKGTYIDVNESFSKLTGYSKEELIGLTSSELNMINTERRERLINEFDDNASINDKEFEIRTKSGEKRYIMNNVESIELSDEIAFISFIYDITERKQAEEKLKESEARFRSVLENSQDVIYRFNLQTNRYEYMSPAIRALGFEPEELMAMSDDEVISRVHPDDRPDLLSVLSKINQTGKEWAEYRFRGNDDIYRWWSNQMGIIKDSEGKPLYRDGSVRDITKRKQAEIELKETLNNLEQLVEYRTKELILANDYNRNLLETALDPLVTIGPDGKITDVNRATEEVTGYSREDLVGTDFADYFTNPKKAEEGYQEVFKQGEVRDYPLKIKHRYGSITPVLYNASVYKDESGDVVGVFAAARDITERQKAEDAFRVYWESLEEQVEQRTEELAKSNADLKQFAYVASHDLREPLRMISSFLQLLERRYKDELDEDAKEFIGFAVDGAKRLDKMITDLLEYSRIANKEMQFTDVNIQHVVEQVTNNFNVLIQENSATITYDQLPIIRSDENQMIILFQNLISNAIKYRREDTPQIHIYAEKDGNQYVFNVKDNGIGIDPKHLERIFTIFKRLHSHDEYEGSGIGLSIAQRIVHQHGGEIWAESEPGKGSTFYFTIPEN
jgi:two-component system, chemotaxis family, sensor kinase Cph1